MKRRWLFLILIWSLTVGTVSVHRAIERFHRPPPAWMGTEQWYDHALQALCFASVAVACISYECRRIMCRRQGVVLDTRLWRNRTELRGVLYAYALLTIVGAMLKPLNVFRAMHDPGSPRWVNFWSMFPFEMFLYLLIGVAVIIYDRRRLLRDRKDAGECLKCGYDLRASKDRCPECGTPVPPRVQSCSDNRRMS